MAQSIFSHTYPDLAQKALQEIARTLGSEGILLATFIEGEECSEGSGWRYPDGVTYSWGQIRNLVEQSGLVSYRLCWPHPRQVWFVAGKPANRKKVATLAAGIRPSLDMD